METINTGWYGTQPKTTTKKTTTTKKKFDEKGRVVSETTTVVEESVTTYDTPLYSTTSTAGNIKYGRSASQERPLE
jgi:hypothetical protein